VHDDVELFGLIHSCSGLDRRVDARIGAKVRNEDIRSCGCVKYRLALNGNDLLAVDGQAGSRGFIVHSVNKQEPV
jgi:hypothetical protein